jgi:hypothetical protein
VPNGRFRVYARQRGHIKLAHCATPYKTLISQRGANLGAGLQMEFLPRTSKCLIYFVKEFHGECLLRDWGRNIDNDCAAATACAGKRPAIGDRCSILHKSQFGDDYFIFATSLALH